MANETTPTSINDIVPLIIAESYRKLNQNCGIMQTIRTKDISAQAGISTIFPSFSKISAGDVGSPAFGAEYNTNKEITTDGVTATVTRHALHAKVPEITLEATNYDLINTISSQFANGMQAKIESEVVALFADFNSGNDLAGAGVTMTFADFMKAIKNIMANDGDVMQMSGILSPSQIWGSKGLSSILVDADANAGGLGETMKNNGWVRNIAGIDIYASNQINEDVGSGGDAAGGIYTRGAIGMAYKNIAKIKVAEDPKSDGWLLTCNGYWDIVKLEDTWGCYFLSDVS